MSSKDDLVIVLMRNGKPYKAVQSISGEHSERYAGEFCRQFNRRTGRSDKLRGQRIRAVAVPLD